MLKIYVCGPTVYNDLHIGNIRPILNFDLMLRAYRNTGKDFILIHNITDIDDKIINKALEENVDELVISQRYANQYIKLLQELNIKTISHLEYVRDNLDVMKKYIENIRQNKDAYLDKEGNVLFDVEKNKKAYGTVSNQKIEQMVFEQENSTKKHPSDFSLWKKTNVGVKFNSQFGEGRPGWHTECCAIIDKHFPGQGVDIHGGGIDLKFPHHENENIQHYSLYKKPLAKNWIHCGHINYNGEKMSKSLGNVILAKDFLEEHGSNTFRMILLLADITSPMNLSDSLIENSKKIYAKIKQVAFKNFLLDANKIIDLNEELYIELNSLVANLKNSDFNFNVNNLLKQLNKNFDSKLATTLVKVFEDLGFNFEQYTFKDFKIIYQNWQNLLLNKTFDEADKLRKILIKNNLI
ncbi:class I tRNA ligase family protein [Mycoplasma crocodyli]|uniref:Cysteine--tRNA ligase n=1 Tax=Mycoplasma crocodyli (strain ATCC 51981 / MP145) TaxID=512564 RepID=D5E623_MYCCM|nr:class I tRNA ligase family protein [Mycoplasma crocodyli]ADE19998.1 cysteine--tRNA ligase [Mycoplasma crocodyli MP145]